MTAGAVFTSMTMATDSTEEVFIGTSQSGVDTDVDGIPDPVEYRFQTDAVRRDDIGDLDWDLTPNGVELRTAVTRSAMMRMYVAASYDYQIRRTAGGRRDNLLQLSRWRCLLPTHDEMPGRTWTWTQPHFRFRR